MMCIDTLYMLPVRRRTRGTEEIEEMRKQEDEETKRRRNELLQLISTPSAFYVDLE